MKISVIIVSYNCKAFLDYCLQSVTKALRQIDSEILVIDNCSTDGSVEYLKSKTYDIRIVENKKNLGFSKANNKAAKLAKGEYLFFLNPDTIIPEDLIDSFFKNKKPNTGIFGFRMIDGEGIFLKESKRNFPEISIISKKLIGINSGYYFDLGEFDSGIVDVLCGANMIIENHFSEKSMVSMRNILCLERILRFVTKHLIKDIITFIVEVLHLFTSKGKVL